MAKKIRLLPDPHMEIRIHVSDQMTVDLKECGRMAQEQDGLGKDCDTCSWRNVGICGVNMCELPDVCRRVLREEN